MAKNTRRMSSAAAAALLCAVGWTGEACAADPVRVTLKDHRFTPEQVTVPSGERFHLEVSNQDPTPAEFESGDLRAEKIIVPGGTVTMMAGPLKPGSYRFFDDYHPDVAVGTVVAVDRLAKD